MIRLDGHDIGWMQTWPEPDSLYLSQLFIEAPFQNRGLGARKSSPASSTKPTPKASRRP